MTALSVQEQAFLALERTYVPSRPGAKDDVVQQLFGLTGARYHQLLTHLIDRPEALAHDPVTVNRLRRLRATRGARRAALRGRPEFATCSSP